MAQPTQLLILTTLLGAGAGAGAALLVGGGTHSQAAPPRELSPDGLSALRASVERMEERQLAFEARWDGGSSNLAAPLREQVQEEDLESLVQRLVAEAMQQSGAPIEAPSDFATLAVDDLYARLQDPALSFEEREQLWQSLRDAGRTEELVAMLKARAEADPTDPELAVELGQGYLQRIQEVGNGPLAGVYATQADEAFDRALELDPQHWDARFNKAVALSFWPPVLGKQPSAIAEFETLVSQQAQLAPQPAHAQAHLLLGNLYQQTGQLDKAMAAWSTGAQLFPDDPGLAQQLALSQGDGQ